MPCAASNLNRIATEATVNGSAGTAGYGNDIIAVSTFVNNITIFINITVYSHIFGGAADCNLVYPGTAVNRMCFTGSHLDRIGSGIAPNLYAADRFFLNKNLIVSGTRMDIVIFAGINVDFVYVLSVAAVNRMFVPGVDSDCVGACVSAYIYIVFAAFIDIDRVVTFTALNKLIRTPGNINLIVVSFSVRIIERAALDVNLIIPCAAKRRAAAVAFAVNRKYVNARATVNFCGFSFCSYGYGIIAFVTISSQGGALLNINNVIAPLA